MRNISSASAIALIPNPIALMAGCGGAIARALVLIATATSAIAIALSLIAAALAVIVIALSVSAIAISTIASCALQETSGFTLVSGNFVLS